MATITMQVDDDDEKAIRKAMASLQDTWVSGVMLPLPEGDSDTAGAIVGEICRQWLDARGEW